MPCSRPLRFVTALCAALPGLAAHACTVCDSRNGHQLRAGLFDGHLLHTGLLIAAPFPVFAALILLLHLGMPDLPELPRQQAALVFVRPVPTETNA